MNPKLGDCIHDALDRLEHNSTVGSFYHKFAAIQGLLLQIQPWLPEKYLATRFVYGLRPEYQLFGFRFNPITVLAAYRLAEIYEESVDIHDIGEQVLGVEYPDLDSNSPLIKELGNFLHDNMDQLTHTTSVEVFYHQFEAVKSVLVAAKPWLPESYFASRFVYGLQEEYLNFVLRFNRVTVTAAYRIACIYEDSIYLEYFPESLSQKGDIFGIMAEEKQLVAPNLDQVGEEVLRETLSSTSTFSTNDIRSVWVEKGVVDTLNGGVAVASPRKDVVDSVVLLASQRSDTGSPNVSLGHGNISDACMNNSVNYLAANLAKDCYYAKNSYPRIALVPCKSKHKFLYLKIGCSWIHFCPNCLEATKFCTPIFLHSRDNRIVGVIELALNPHIGIDTGQHLAIHDYMVIDEFVTGVNTLLVSAPDAELPGCVSLTMCVKIPGTNNMTTQVPKVVNETEDEAYGLVLDAQSSCLVDHHFSNPLALSYSASTKSMSQAHLQGLINKDGLSHRSVVVRHSVLHAVLKDITHFPFFDFLYSKCTFLSCFHGEFGVADHDFVSTPLPQMDGSPVVTISLPCIEASKRSTLKELQGDFSGFVLEPGGQTICYIPVQVFGAVVPLAIKDVYAKYTHSIISTKTVGDVQSAQGITFQYVYNIQYARSMLLVKCLWIKLTGVEAMEVLYGGIFHWDKFVVMLVCIWYVLHLTVSIDHLWEWNKSSGCGYCVQRGNVDLFKLNSLEGSVWIVGRISGYNRSGILEEVFSLFHFLRATLITPNEIILYTLNCLTIAASLGEDSGIKLILYNAPYNSSAVMTFHNLVSLRGWPPPSNLQAVCVALVLTLTLIDTNIKYLPLIYELNDFYDPTLIEGSLQAVLATISVANILLLVAITLSSNIVWKQSWDKYSNEDFLLIKFKWAADSLLVDIVKRLHSQCSHPCLYCVNSWLLYVRATSKTHCFEVVRTIVTRTCGELWRSWLGLSLVPTEDTAIRESTYNIIGVVDYRLDLVSNGYPWVKLALALCPTGLYSIPRVKEPGSEQSLGHASKSGTEYDTVANKKATIVVEETVLIWDPGGDTLHVLLSIINNL